MKTFVLFKNGEKKVFESPKEMIFWMESQSRDVLDGLKVSLGNMLVPFGEYDPYWAYRYAVSGVCARLQQEEKYDESDFLNFGRNWLLKNKDTYATYLEEQYALDGALWESDNIVKKFFKEN